jgi:hypothetical protein
MGRQVNFYMNADDQARMNEIILSGLPEVVVLKREINIQALEFLDTTERKDCDGESYWVLLARQHDIKKIIIDPPFMTTVPPFRVRNIVNLDLSPVVDYHRCAIRPNEPNGPIIQSGRIYYHAEYYTNNYTVKVSKDPEFIKFAQKLFGLFKKNLIYIKERGFHYYGEGALRDEKNGWILR